MPGHDVDGKLWTIQYIKEDGTKRFAKDSRKHGCFYVVGAPNGAAALQQIAMSPVVVIAEGYATAATLVKHGKVPTLAAYDHPSDGLGALQKRDVRFLLGLIAASLPLPRSGAPPGTPGAPPRAGFSRGPEWLSPEVVERVEHQLAIVSQNREGNSALVRS